MSKINCFFSLSAIVFLYQTHLVNCHCIGLFSVEMESLYVRSTSIYFNVNYFL